MSNTVNKNKKLEEKRNLDIIGRHASVTKRANGKHKVEVLYTDEHTVVGYVNITDALNASYTLPDLLSAAFFDISA